MYFFLKNRTNSMITLKIYEGKLSQLKRRKNIEELKDKLTMVDKFRFQNKCLTLSTLKKAYCHLLLGFNLQESEATKFKEENRKVQDQEALNGNLLDNSIELTTNLMQVDTEKLLIHDSVKHENEIIYNRPDEDYSIDQFLNFGAFVDKNNQEMENDYTQKQQRFGTYSTELGHEEINETPQKTKKKSIFHNFQKHLITLLKKHFKITLKTFQGAEENQLAFTLWQVFVKTKSYNKKILHIIFGIQEGPHAQSEYDSLTQQFKEFRSLRNKHPLTSIMKAQDLIRLQIIEQSKSLNRLLLEANCNVSRLQLFWEYFTSFILELGDGPMAKRMTKEQKGRLVQKVSCKIKGN